MADALVGITLLLTDNIRGCLQKAAITEDITDIRSILSEIEMNVDQLVAVAKAEEPVEE